MNNFFNLDYWKEIFIGSPIKKRLVENFLSLSALQAVNYLLPLITFPYLVRVLGPEKYGLLAFVQAVIGYFVIFTDYGFNLSATRQISVHRENKEKISEIFSSVITLKFLLGIVSFFVLSLFLVFIPRFRDDWIVYIFTFGTVLGNVLFPVWFFQGMEKMRYITGLHILAKSIFTVSIFVFIKEMKDYLYVPLINSLGYLVAGVISLRVVFKEFGTKFILSTVESLTHQLKEGWPIFISTVAISLYTTSRIFIVGLFTNNTITGYYSIAEKLMSIFQTFPLASLLQSLYPRLSLIYSIDRKKAFRVMRKFQNITSLAYLLLTLIFIIFSSIIVKIIAGNPYKETIIVLRILFLAVFFINANAFRIQFLLVSGNEDIYSKIHIYMGILGILLIVILTHFYSYIGPAISILLIALFVLLITIKYISNLEKEIA